VYSDNIIRRRFGNIRERVIQKNLSGIIKKRISGWSALGESGTERKGRFWGVYRGRKVPLVPPA